MLFFAESEKLNRIHSNIRPPSYNATVELNVNGNNNICAHFVASIALSIAGCCKYRAKYCCVLCINMRTGWLVAVCPGTPALVTQLEI